MSTVERSQRQSCQEVGGEPGANRTKYLKETRKRGGISRRDQAAASEVITGRRTEECSGKLATGSLTEALKRAEWGARDSVKTCE